MADKNKPAKPVATEESSAEAARVAGLEYWKNAPDHDVLKHVADEYRAAKLKELED